MRSILILLCVTLFAGCSETALPEALREVRTEVPPHLLLPVTKPDLSVETGLALAEILIAYEGAIDQANCQLLTIGGILDRKEVKCR